MSSILFNNISHVDTTQSPNLSPPVLTSCFAFDNNKSLSDPNSSDLVANSTRRQHFDPPNQKAALKMCLCSICIWQLRTGVIRMESRRLHQIWSHMISQLKGDESHALGFGLCVGDFGGCLWELRLNYGTGRSAQLSPGAAAPPPSLWLEKFFGVKSVKTGKLETGIWCVRNHAIFGAIFSVFSFKQFWGIIKTKYQIFLRNNRTF